VADLGQCSVFRVLNGLTNPGVLFALLLLLATRAVAGGVALAWDPVTIPQLVGYMVYYGPAAGTYTSSVDVGNTTSYTVTGLTEGATYHFVVTAYDASHTQSGPSNDVSAAVAYSTPVAQFSASTTSGTAPLALNFSSTSTGIINTYAWTFGDSTSSNVQNPSHVYSSAGVYTVSLTVTGPGGSNTKTNTNYITVTASVQPTTTVISSSLNPSVPGAAVTFTATVAGAAPTGSVAFTDGGGAIPGCSAVALPAGASNSKTVTCGTSSLSVGAHNIVASYGGDAGNTGSTSSTLVQTVSKVPSSTSLTTSGSPSQVGTSVTFTATVAGTVPTGSVAFTDGGSAISGCSAVALPAGAASNKTVTCSTGSLSVGAHSIVATYGGDVGNNGSTSATVSQVVNTSGTGTALSSSGTPSLDGAIVTFTATVSGTAPTGSVAFTDGGSAIPGCSAVALPAGVASSKTATCSLSSLSVGAHSIVAAYGGDGANAGSTSGTLTQVVNSGGGGGSDGTEVVWIEDSVPAGAMIFGDGGESWNWVSSNPTPYSGALAHQSALNAGYHQHYFALASATLGVGAGDILTTYVYLDPVNPPSELMLQWNDGSWEHRAYWGANAINLGTDGSVSRRYMGALPPIGQWVRLAVPAVQVGLEGRTLNGMAFTLYGGRATWDHMSKSSPWVQDAVPAGATVTGDGGDTWNWVSSNPAPHSGALAHQSALVAGFHQHYFYGASTNMAVGVGDTLFTYAYLDPVNPPSELMLQWTDGTWEHRAYWGANLIPFGTDGTASRQYMGPLPQVGQWVRLAVPAAQVGLEGATLNGMSFGLYGGRATWDYSSKSSAWVGDALPAGAMSWSDGGDTWNWVSTNPTPLSGTRSHQSALAAGYHQHYFALQSDTFAVDSGDTLFTYVYLDPANPPSEVMLQWFDGTWEHRAYWGANLIALGTDATVSRRYMGALPPTGRWVRLAVPAAQVGLEGRTVNGMAYTLFDGRATWDYTGR
jgi:PKD repeat protein